MATLNLRGVDGELKKRLKVGAASLGKNLVDYCEELLWGGLGINKAVVRGGEGQDLEKIGSVPAREKNPKRVGRVGDNAEVEGGSGVPDPGFGAEGDLSWNRGLPTPRFEGVPEFMDPITITYHPAAKVPEEAVAFAKSLTDKVEAMTGADPQILNTTEKSHARTLQGVNAAEAHRNAKRKKIASVSASPVPDPGKSQEKQNVQTQSASKETQEDRKEDRSPQRQSAPPLAENQMPTGRRLDHDPDTCRMYGCLMCKLAKGE